MPIHCRPGKSLFATPKLHGDSVKVTIRVIDRQRKAVLFDGGHQRDVHPCGWIRVPGSFYARPDLEFTVTAIMTRDRGSEAEIFFRSRDPYYIDKESAYQGSADAARAYHQRKSRMR